MYVCIRKSYGKKSVAPFFLDTVYIYMKVDKTTIFTVTIFTGPHTMELPWNYQIGSVGKEISGCSTKLDDREVSGNGEVSF